MKQGNLFDPEPVAHTRWGDPETSHDAAASVQQIRASQQAVWRVLELYPNGLIDQELVAIYQSTAQRGHCRPQSESGIRTRRAELVEMARVVDSGQRRLTDTGRRSIVWIAV